MGCRNSKVPMAPTIVTSLPRLPSQLQNLFLIGYLGSEAVDFVKTFCRDQIIFSDGFVHGEIPSMGTHVWAYQYPRYDTCQDEIIAWELLRKKIQNETYMVALCFPYGERFVQDSIENYVMEMYRLFKFKTLICIMNGGKAMNRGKPNLSADQFYGDLLHYAGSVAKEVKTWLPTVSIYYYISGVNIYDKLNGRESHQKIIRNEANRLLGFIRTMNVPTLSEMLDNQSV